MFRIDSVYTAILTEQMAICSSYVPHFGMGSKRESLTELEFQQRYQSDPLYHAFGLDTPEMYQWHCAAGKMTSIYRNLGTAVEKLAKEIIQDGLEIDSTQADASSYGMDVVISADHIRSDIAKLRFTDWVKTIKPDHSSVVFEIRQGHKTKDAKRQNADIDNSSRARRDGHLPCFMFLSDQVDPDILRRYAKHAIVLPAPKTYEFFVRVIGFDLLRFFARNPQIRVGSANKNCTFIDEYR